MVIVMQSTPHAVSGIRFRTDENIRPGQRFVGRIALTVRRQNVFFTASIVSLATASFRIQTEPVSIWIKGLQVVEPNNFRRLILLCFLAELQRA
jgi:hypothetical protein